jgi:hypothetical protein
MHCKNNGAFSGEPLIGGHVTLLDARGGGGPSSSGSKKIAPPGVHAARLEQIVDGRVVEVLHSGYALSAKFNTTTA